MTSLTDGSTLSFTYNADGLRQSRTVDGTTTRFVYSGLRLLQETNSGGTTQVDYTLAPIGGEWEPLVSHRKSGASRFYAFDVLGTTRALTDGSEDVAAVLTDDAWGNVLNASDSSATAQQYVGRYGYYLDGASGLQLLTQRYYDPAAGRFVSEDPAMADENWWAYGLGNPAMMVDPAGERCWVAGLEKREVFQEAVQSRTMFGFKIRVWGLIAFVARVRCDNCTETPSGFRFFQWVLREADCGGPTTTYTPPEPDDHDPDAQDPNRIQRNASGPFPCRCGATTGHPGAGCSKDWLYVTTDGPGVARDEPSVDIKTPAALGRCDVEVKLLRPRLDLFRTRNYSDTHKAELQTGFGRSTAEVTVNWEVHWHAGRRTRPGHVVPYFSWTW